MRKKIELTCPTCTKSYLKDVSEYNRNIKIGRISVCSLKCIVNNIDNIPLDKRNTYDISKHSSNRKDKFSAFKYILRRLKIRNKEVTVTLEDLKEQWDTQRGICPYTLVDLELYKSKNDNLREQEFPFSFASLDRIDSSKGYIKNNIEFISIGINLMKNEFSREQTLNFINQIVKNKTSLSDLN